MTRDELLKHSVTEAGRRLQKHLEKGGPSRSGGKLNNPFKSSTEKTSKKESARITEDKKKKKEQALRKKKKELALRKKKELALSKKKTSLKKTSLYKRRTKETYG